VALRRARPSCRAPARPAKLPPMMMTSSMVMGSVLWMEGVGLGLARNIVQRYALEPAFVFVCHGLSFRDSRYYNFVIGYYNFVMASVSSGNRTSLPVPGQGSAAQPGGSMGDVPSDPTPGVPERLV